MATSLTESLLTSRLTPFRPRPAVYVNGMLVEVPKNAKPEAVVTMVRAEIQKQKELQAAPQGPAVVVALNHRKEVNNKLNELMSNDALLLKQSGVKNPEEQALFLQAVKDIKKQSKNGKLPPNFQAQVKEQFKQLKEKRDEKLNPDKNKEVQYLYSTDSELTVRATKDKKKGGDFKIEQNSIGRVAYTSNAKKTTQRISAVASDAKEVSRKQRLQSWAAPKPQPQPVKEEKEAIFHPNPFQTAPKPIPQ